MAVSRAIARQAFPWTERRRFPSFSLRGPASHRAAEVLGISMMDAREGVLAYALAGDRFRFATGHIPCRPRLLDEFSPEWRFVTVLRDPVQRWISEYVYNSRKASPWGAIALPVEEYLELPHARTTATSFLRYFSNLGDVEDGDQAPFVREAIANLARFSVVGFVEEMPRFVHDFEAAFGRRLRIPRTNESPSGAAKRAILGDPVLLDRVTELCAADTEVYRAVLAARAGAGSLDLDLPSVEWSTAG